MVSTAQLNVNFSKARISSQLSLDEDPKQIQTTTATRTETTIKKELTCVSSPKTLSLDEWK